MLALLTETLSFPFEDPVVVIKATGKAIVEALENGVSTYPALEGRFPQVSGIQFTFDPSKPQGQRIIETSINGSPVELERLYQMSTRGYMARGKDGYDSLLVDAEGGQCSEVVSEENGVLISTIVRQFFMSMKILDRWRMWSRGMQRHWGNVLTGLNHSGSWVVDPTCKRPPKQRTMSQKAHPEDLVDSDTEPEDEPNPRPRSCQNDQEEVLIRRILRKWRRLAGVKEEGEACDALGIDEYQISWTKVRYHAQSESQINEYPGHCTTFGGTYQNSWQGRGFMIVYKAVGYRSCKKLLIRSCMVVHTGLPLKYEEYPFRNKSPDFQFPIFNSSLNICDLH